MTVATIEYSKVMFLYVFREIGVLSNLGGVYS